MKLLELIIESDGSSIWSEKCVLFAFYQQLIQRLKWQRNINIAYWTIFAATFLAVEAATFLDCRPFRLYFEVVSNPNSCIRAYSQIISYGKNLTTFLISSKYIKCILYSDSSILMIFLKEYVTFLQILCSLFFHYGYCLSSIDHGDSKATIKQVF